MLFADRAIAVVTVHRLLVALGVRRIANGEVIVRRPLYCLSNANVAVYARPCEFVPFRVIVMVLPSLDTARRSVKTTAPSFLQIAVNVRSSTRRVSISS